MVEQFELIKKRTAEIVPEEELKEKLKKGRPLRVKLGIDASGPDIHLGFAVVLRKLRQFQDLGHTAILIVGDFTAKIGDPSGRSKTRPQLTDEEVKKNMERYREQIFKILREDRVEFVYNSHWLSKLTAEDVVKLSAKYTVARMLERDDFKKRFKDGNPIAIHEFLYPLFQAYDSVVVRSDVELGGTDQKFNLMVAREIQREFGQEPEVAVLMPILEGLDGKLKMSKSYGNYIGITEPPKEMFGKVMSIPDSLILKYYELCLDLPDEELERIKRKMENPEVNPRDLKFELAKRIVALYHSKEDAERAAEEFERVFRHKELPEEMEEYVLHWNDEKIWIVKLLTLTGLASSGSEARRLIKGGAVSVDGERIMDINIEIPVRDMVLRVGKKRFLRIRKGGDAEK